MSILRISSQIMLATSLTILQGALSRNKCTENNKRRSTYHSRLTM